MVDLESVECEVVAVTGGIGSGKSTVSQLFREFGATIVSADELARRVVGPGSPTLLKIVGEFGDTVLADDGTLDRRALGRIVFSDPSKRLQLEQITHPAIRELSASEFRLALQNGAPLVIYDCPLLFEAGLDRLKFRAIVVVSASPERCAERVVQRDGLTIEEINGRIAAQLPLEEKAKRGSHVINNDGDIDALRTAVAGLYSQFAVKG